MIKAAFWGCEPWYRSCFEELGLTLSESFCAYNVRMVSNIVQTEASLKPSSRVSLSLMRYTHEWDWPGRSMYEPGEVSRINTALSILPGLHDPISFCWRSKSGKLVKPTDESFDEADLECWIEGLKPKLYWDYLNQVHNDYPFKVKNLPFPVVVTSFDTHCVLQIALRNPAVSEDIVLALSNTIEKHNLASEKKDRANGVVHNSWAEMDENLLCFHIDLGSAGPVFIKKLLRTLAKFEAVKKVTVSI